MNLTALALDTQYEAVTITSVDKGGKDGWGITLSTGWSSFCPKNESGVVPKVGDDARLYGEGIGRAVRGLVVNGAPVFYRTVEEQEREHEAWCTEYHAKKRMDFEKSKARLDADYAALPAEFQSRLDRFRRNRDDFRWENEDYEMSACKDAVAIAAACGTPELVAAFHEMTWEQQKQKVPSLFDGHSGNSFGAACYLARLYLERPDLVDKAHGALCPLVGCKEYGCYASEKQVA